MRWLALVALLVLSGCSLVAGMAGQPALPHELRCHDDIDAATCRARAAELAAQVGAPGDVIESIDISRAGYGICLQHGCIDGVYPDSD